MGQFEAFIGVNFWTALFVLLNTLTIFFVGKKYLFGPVMKIIQQRQEEIDSMYHSADQATIEAEALRGEYQNKLSEAQATSDRLVKEAVVRAQNREEEIICKARREAERMRDQASADIAQEKKKALNDAKDEIFGLALSIAGKAVGRVLTEQDQASLVDQFINELGEQS